MQSSLLLFAGDGDFEPPARYQTMTDNFDIFRVEAGGAVMWRSAAATIDEAKAHIRQFALRSPGLYIIVDERTGEKILIGPNELAAE
jgi:hypothetical protein